MSDILALSDKLFKGQISTEETQPFAYFGELTEVADGVGFVPSFANVSVVSTEDGLVLVDTGSPMFAGAVRDHIRVWSKDRLSTAIYSHGHIDHVFGVPIYEEEATSNGWPQPRVISQAGVPRRFDRYVMTAGYNATINRRQFQIPGLEWPKEYRYPDETFRRTHKLEVGGVAFELNHAKGETDDHAWTWIPQHKLLCTGDLFIWVSPNAGNPQKVQRYPRDWAIALREMAELGAEILLPGHGLPVVGADRIKLALTESADFLTAIVDATLEMMNDGASLDEIVHTVKPPPALLDRPYLRPLYDEPEFIVRSIWRLYGGWYEGNPANLKPAPEAELAAELAGLAGGAANLTARALELTREGNFRVASHLVQLASQASPDDPAVHEARAAVFEARMEHETSTMSKGIFAWAASESRRKSGK